jgi:predicted nucleic acid-binding protein
MNVVDSSGWIEYLTQGQNSAFFLPVVQETQDLLVPTLSIYEVFKRVMLETDAETALQTIGVMALGSEVPLDREIAIEAAHVSVEFKLAMADSIMLATARVYDAVLWTQDAHFKNIDGVKYIEKKSSK